MSRTVDEILKDYVVATKDSTMIEQPGFSRVYIFKNQGLRDQLRQEYVSLYPADKRLAVHILELEAKYRGRTEFWYELDGIHDLWNEYLHVAALARAQALLKCISEAGDFTEEQAYSTALTVAHILLSETKG